MSLSPSHTALIDECLAWEQRGDLPNALHWAQNQLKAAQASGQTEATAAALVAVARLRFRLGQYETARSLATEALGMLPVHSPICADAWQVLANCVADAESLAQAEAYYRLAADVARENNYPRAQIAALHGLAAGVYFPRGQFDLALTAANEALRLAREHTRIELLVFPQVILALIYQTIGRRQQTLTTLHELEHSCPSGSLVQGYAFCIRGGLALESGELEAARDLFSQARPIAEATGEPWLNCTVRLGMSVYHRLVGNGADAHAWANDALTFASRLGFRHEQGKALIERGRAAWLCEDTAAAESDLTTAIEILQAFGAGFDLARARLLLAAILQQQNSPAVAAAWQAAARAIIEGGYAFLLQKERALAFPLLAAFHTNPDQTLARWSAILLIQLRRVPPPALHVEALGRFVVRQESRRVDEGALRQRRAGELLGLLLLTPQHCLTTDQVAEALFPNKDRQTVQKLLHQATSALRRALEPDLPPKFPSRYLDVQDEHIALALPPDSWLDFAVFEEHCRRGEWEQALALYHGDLLPAFRYNDWAFLPRERLGLLHQRALLGAAEERLAAGSFAEALDASRRLLEIEPWHEQAALIGMRACLELKDRAGALRLYQTIEAALRRDLDVAPCEELQALYRALTR